MKTTAVLEHLRRHCRGAANAQTKKQIAHYLFGDESLSRSVERAVSELRKNHFVPIASSCSGQKGYFIAETVEEWERFTRQVNHRFQEASLLKMACVHTLSRLKAEKWNNGIKYRNEKKIKELLAL